MSEPLRDSDTVDLHLLTGQELALIGARLEAALNAVQSLRGGVFTLTEDKANVFRMQVFASAADVGPLIKEVALLRQKLQNVLGYLHDFLKERDAEEGSLTENERVLIEMVMAMIQL